MSAPTDPIEICRANLRISLAPYFKGKVMETKLNDAVEEALKSINGLIRLDSVNPGKKGATVMTEDAAVKRSDGGFTSRPRNL